MKLKSVFVAMAGLVLVVLALTVGAFWRIWDRPEHAHRECLAAVAIAAEIASAKGLENGFDELLVSFWPTLDGSPAYMSGLPPAFTHLTLDTLPWWPETVVAVARSQPSALDCRNELSTNRSVRIEPDFRAPQELGIAKYRFSRIVFSMSGDEAFVHVTMLCGSLCANGWSTVWRREKNRWVLLRKNPIWLS